MPDLVSFTDKEGNVKLWRVFINFAQQRPTWFLIFLAVQFVVVLLTFSGDVGFGQALGMAFLVDLLWLLIFIALPALFSLLMGLAVFLMAVFITITAVQYLGTENFLTILLVFVIALAVAALLIALATLVLYCLPGLLAGSLVYQASQDQAAAIITFVVVTIITVVLVYIFSKYILPFIFGFGLNWVALSLSIQIAASIVLGISAYELMQSGVNIYQDGASIRSLSGAGGILRQIGALLGSIFRLPAGITLWATISGIFFGLLNTPVRDSFMRRTVPFPVYAAAPISAAPVPATAPLPIAPVPAAVPTSPGFCPACGAKQAPGSAFCHQCGMKHT